MWKFWRQIWKIRVGFFITWGRREVAILELFSSSAALVCLQVTSCREKMPEKYSERQNACAERLCLHPMQLTAYAATKLEQILSAWQNF